jgi:hypothetical protein
LKESPSVVLGMGEILILAWSTTCTYDWFSINSFASYVVIISAVILILSVLDQLQLLSAISLTPLVDGK